MKVNNEKKQIIYRLPILSTYPRLVHGISTRPFGDMGSSYAINEEKMRRFFSALTIPWERRVGLHQKHTGIVRLVDKETSLVSDCDGIITHKKSLFLSVVTADCLPVIFYDPKKNLVGVAHAGYKGLHQKILRNMVDTFSSMGANKKDIKVGIGPGIGVCCYSVDDKRIDLFSSYHDYFEKRSGKLYLDLKKIAVEQLVSAGIDKNNIEVSDYCTKDNNDLFFSYRAEGKKFGEFTTVVGIL